MPVSSWCKKHNGQERDCARCPGPGTVLGVEMVCDCKCHREEK